MSNPPSPPRKPDLDPAPAKTQDAPDDGFPADRDVSIPPHDSDPAAKARDPLTAYGEAATDKDPDEVK